MKLIMLGPPGAGKGTYAKKLVKKFEIPQISTGDILRAAIKNGTDVGMKAKEFMDRGELVPDQVIIDIISERIKENDCANGFIFDGFPRTIPQAEMLEDLLKERGINMDAVVNISVPDNVLIARLTSRRTCKSCGEIYNVISAPPKTEGVCDKCSGELMQRDDEKEETIKHRLEVYKKQTYPLIDFYKGKDLLKNVETITDGSIEENYELVLKTLL